MAGSSLFANLGRAAKVLALLLFFLPWVTVSCSADGLQRMQAMEQGRAGLPPQRQVQLPTAPDFAPSLAFAKATGLNMAMGTVQLLPLPQYVASGGATRQLQQPPSVPPEIAVIAGATLILIALIATFLRSALGFMVGAGSTLLAVCAICFSVFVHYPPVVIASVAGAFSQMGPRSSTPPSADQLAQIFVVKPEGVFYFLLALLLAAIACDIVAMKKVNPKPETVF
jgi:hypothetical protein